MRKGMLAVAGFAAMALMVVACGGGDGGGGGDTGTAMPGKATCTAAAGENVLCGNVFAADGVTPLAGAEIQLSNASANVSAGLTTKGVDDSTKCLADTQGNFVCLVPSTGTKTFIVVFPGLTKTFTQDVQEGTNDAGNITTEASTTARWVVVPGAFDGVQVLLAQLKNCVLNDAFGDPFDPTTGDAASARWSQDCEDKGLTVLDISDPTSERYVTTFLTGSSLSSYAALFINCAADYSFETGVDEAIQAFSEAGGHVYFSDLADSWLTSAFPGSINFAGNSTSTGTVSGDVVYAALAAFVGNPINIVFDLDVWTAIDTVESNVTTFIQGDITAYSSYPGVHPITVGWRPSTSSGCIFYTSYHIEGASTGSAQELAIKYLVLNIASVCQ